MSAPHLLRVQVEDEVVRRVFDRRDLLEHNFPLEVEIRTAKDRFQHQVTKHVERNIDVLGIEHACLKARVLPRRVCVQRPTQTLEDERQVLRTATMPCP
jgi:hypothetical protein